MRFGIIGAGMIGHFHAKGDYTVGEGDKVDYNTRASSVWISTENGWKIMHSSWAPFGGGNGIPNN